MNPIFLSLLALALWGPDDGAGPGTADVRIQISRKVEEGKAMLVATVLRSGKPVEGARVVFFAERLLGWLPLGSDVTLDDGTAAVAFPADLPSSADGMLKIKAAIDDPPALRSLSQTSSMPGGRPVQPKVDPFPRTLWGPRAPIALLLTFGILLTGVWAAYAFIFLQLLKIVRGAKS